MSVVVRNFIIVVAVATGIIVGTGIWHYQVNGNGNTNSGTGFIAGGVVIGTFPCVVGGQVNGFIPFILDNYRASKGLSNGAGFVFDSAALQNIAQSRVTDMVKNNYVGVINSQGQDIPTEFATKGISFKSAGMIVFKGCLGTPADNNNALAAWLADPASAALLNNPTWTDFDFGTTFVITNVTNSTGFYLIVVVFRQA